jgi:hypothetical protein
VTPSELTPELKALVTAARELPHELVRQVTDFAEFLDAKYSVPMASAVDEETVHDEDEVDLSGGGRSSVSNPDDWADLSGVFRNFDGHSAIGLV